MSLLNQAAVNPTAQHETVEPIAETESALTPEQQKELDKQMSVDHLKREYFPSSKLDAAQAVVDKALAIAEYHGLDMVFNFDTEADFPAGYGLAIVPVQKTEKSERVTKGVAIAAIPDVATVEDHEHGRQFVVDAATGSMIAKLANAVRPRGSDGETAASIPFSIEDFITSNRPEGVLLGYRTYASAYVKVLKKKGIKFITDSILRQTLQSAAFAESQFKSVPQTVWVQIIDSMIARCEKDAIAPGMLSEWKKSRDSATLEDKEVDLSDLNFNDIKELDKAEETEVQPEAATV